MIINYFLLIHRKASMIGEGKLIIIKPEVQTARFQCKLLLGNNASIEVNDSIDPKYLVPQKVTPKQFIIPGEVAKKSKRVGECDDNPKDLDASFSCPNHPCEAKYSKSELLQDHLLSNQCYIPEQGSIGSYMKIKYFSHWGNVFNFH